MITVRHELCRKRDQMDRLKTAFSLVANAALGAGSACLLRGENGVLLYGAPVLGWLISSSLPQKNSKNAYLIPDDTKKLLADFAERAKMEVPPLEISDDPTMKIRATRYAIRAGSRFFENTEKEYLSAALGHELGHIKRKDVIFKNLSWTFIAATLLSNSSITVLQSVSHQTQTVPTPSLTSALLTTVSAMALQWLLERWMNRTVEFRADRFELQHSRSPLAPVDWLTPRHSRAHKSLGPALQTRAGSPCRKTARAFPLRQHCLCQSFNFY